MVIVKQNFKNKFMITEYGEIVAAHLTLVAHFTVLAHLTLVAYFTLVAHVTLLTFYISGTF